MRAITVNGKAAQWVGQGFPWVYPAEVTKGGAAPGAVVELRDGKGRSLGTAIADTGFLAARVMRHDGGPLDAAWLAGVVSRARALRRLVVDGDTNGYRLVHAENDGLPGIRVDRWARWAVVTLDSASLVQLVDPLIAVLSDAEDLDGVVVCHRRDHRDRPSQPPPHLAWGAAPPEEVEVRERGLQFGVRPLTGPDVGLFADMRDVRRWLEPSWAGTRVLNLFAYTAAFSVSAGAHGAAETLSVDLSGPILERARDNLQRNGLDPRVHALVEGDVFRVLDRLRRKGERFDRVVVDPPSFSRGEAVFSARRDWPRLVGACARVLCDGGWLVAASNQGELSPKVFDGLLADGLRKAGRGGQLLLATSAGPDFPAHTTFPEGRYLKVRVMAVA